MKCIIAGTRTFGDYDLLRAKMDKVLSNVDSNITIISGGASGADELGEKYATERVLRLYIIPAKWNEYGKAAGPIRNEQMAKVADACVCFWDGKSKGTANMIEKAKEYNLKLRVIRYE